VEKDSRVISLSPSVWTTIYAKLSPKNKKFLRRYYKSIYPREYVKVLVSALEQYGFSERYA